MSESIGNSSRTGSEGAMGFPKSEDVMRPSDMKKEEDVGRYLAQCSLTRWSDANKSWSGDSRRGVESRKSALEEEIDQEREEEQDERDRERLKKSRKKDDEFIDHELESEKAAQDLTRLRKEKDSAHRHDTFLGS